MVTLQFTGKLYPFQQKVLDWSQQIQKGIIGLDMGLGKTVITIAIICHRNYQRTLIVLPLQILEQWKSSLVKFTNLTNDDICVYQGRSRRSLHLARYRIVLTTYDVIRTDIALLRQQTDLFDCMILDEAHKLRNKKTLTYETCSAMSQKVGNKWLLTGTTIHNRFEDFSNLCAFLGLDDFYKAMGDATTASEWRNRYYYRLKKSQALGGPDGAHLPEKSLHEHFLNLDPQHLEVYEQLYEETAKFYSDYSAQPTQVNFGALLVKILRLRQCCNHIDAILGEEQYRISKNRHDGVSSAKYNKILEIIQEAPTEDKLIIFSQWSHSLHILSQFLLTRGITNMTYNGEMSIGERNSMLDQFRLGQTRVLLITLTSGGVGLDMSYANHIIIMDSWWNQALEEQAIDRVYRIGQTKKVDVHRLYINLSIEDWMKEMKKEKASVDTHFHDNNEIYNVDTEKLTSLLHLYL